MTHEAYSIAPSLCIICEKKAAQYTCPRCYRFTCSLGCCIEHKGKFACNGKRPSESSIFLPLSRMTDSTLLSDYQLLEKVERGKRSGERLVRDLGCIDAGSSNNNIKTHQGRGKKRPKGFHDNIKSKEEQGQIIPQQPLLLPMTSNHTRIMDSQPKQTQSMDAQYNNSDEILLDDTCFIPKQPLEIPTTTPSVVQLDVLDEEQGNTKNPDDVLPVLTIVPPRTEHCEQEHSSSSSSAVLLQTNTQNTTSRNLHLTANKDWLARYPPYLQKLVDDAERFCNIHLLLMPIGMQRRTLNKDTKYDFKRKGIMWGRIEYIFHSFSQTIPSSHKEMNPTIVPSKAIFTLEHIQDSMTIHSNLLTILNQNLSHSGSYALDGPSRNILKSFCRNVGERTANDEIKDPIGGYSYLLKNDICVLMKKIPCKASDPKFIQLRYTADATLRECLRETTIIEYPTLEVVLRKDLHNLPRFIEEVITDYAPTALE